MRALRYVQKLHETLTEVSESGGNRCLFVILDHNLVQQARACAFNHLTAKAPSHAHANVGMFVNDLMSRDIFSSRLRYCIAKLQEFSIPSSEHLAYISQAVGRHLDDSSAWHPGEANSSNVHQALVSEIARCFAPWYRPDDMFLLDFATEHCLCSRRSHERQWQLTALGRYLLNLNPFETLVILLATEVTLSQRNQSRFVTRNLLKDLRSSTNKSHWGLPYSLRMFDLVVEDLAATREGHASIADGQTILTPLGERVIDAVLESNDRLRELILIMLESEVQGVRDFPNRPAKQAQSSFTMTLLAQPDRVTMEHILTHAASDAYIDALCLLFPLIERTIDALILRAGLQSPGTGMSKKVGLLESKGLLSHERGSFAEIIVARNKVLHGNIGRSDNPLLRPLFDFSLGSFERLVREVDASISQSLAKATP